MSGTVILALSERAAQALEGFLLRHAADRNELVVKISDELGDQLTRVNEEAGAATALAYLDNAAGAAAWRGKTASPAERVADRMAAAASSSITKEPNAA